MIKKYDEFFEKEKKEAEKRLISITSGKNIHELIRYILNFYENKEDTKKRLLFE